MPNKNYDRYLHKELQDPEVASEYLSLALKEGSMEEFLIALRNITEAHGGVGILSKMTDLNRQSMYKMLSKEGNPTLSSLLSVLKVFGIHLTFSSNDKKVA